MALRPKIVKLIDKYSQKRADLVSMNETFVHARTIFDRMMEDSLVRHTGIYEQQSYHGSQYPQGRPDLRGAGRRQDYQAPGTREFGIGQTGGSCRNIARQPHRYRDFGVAQSPLILEADENIRRTNDVTVGRLPIIMKAYGNYGIT